MKVTDETPLFYRVVLKNTKGVIHVQDCDFPPTDDDYDGEVLSVTPLYTHPQPTQKPVGYADAESVAYLLEGGDSGILIVPSPTNTRDTPLYTHPPKREPLSGDNLAEVLKIEECKTVMDIIRAVEKAHGIGVK
jgi:hypothetical protein